jgi:hypothetical protein
MSVDVPTTWVARRLAAGRGLRRECLDHVIVMGERRARGLLEEYADYYNKGRSHQALDGASPNERQPWSPRDGPVVASPVLGGLHHTYRRAS